ncbi:MAG: DEAD/DEAH box helicase, partial [Christensenellales bacterium]
MIAEVIVDVLNSQVDKIFDYKLTTFVQVGTRVVVPFGGRKTEGYILALKQKTDVDEQKLKTIISADSQPVLLPEMIKLIDFMVAEFNLRKIDAIRLMLPSGLRGNKIKQKIVLFAKIKDENFDVHMLKKTAKNQRQCYEFLKQQASVELSVLNNKFSASSVKKLVELGAVEIYQVHQNRSVQSDFANIKSNVTLTPTQNSIVKQISSAKNDIFLLFGVTGSGKTEVYMNVINNVLKNGKTAIMLVPEISLTPQVLKHFKNRFGDGVALLHSGLSLGERYDEWFRILNGDAKIVIGARSAIFAPLKDVGVIVIDEEHDTSYFSESNPRYATIDVAKFRAKYN